MKGQWIRYSPEELQWLEANKTLEIADYHRAFVVQFSRSDVTAANLHALRKRKGWRTGRTGCFAKGDAPFNKGMKCAPGTGGLHPNARKTQFRKGNRSGRANEKYRPIGTERISEDGYRERKVHDGMPLQSRWQLVHRIEWEAAHGPVPDGMALKCKGDRLDTSPDNWEMVPRALLPRLNGGRHKTGLIYDEAPDELKPAIMTTARLAHHVKKKGKGASS